MMWARSSFAFAIISFGISLILSLIEIIKSTKALESKLNDMEDIESSFVNYLKKKPDIE